MDINSIQKRLDALAEGMAAKAVREPSASFSLDSHKELSVNVSQKGKNDRSWRDYEWFKGTPEQALAEAEAYVAALPSPEQARMQAFMESLGATIELGKSADIDVDFVNPPVVLMKQLSKNALTHATQT